MPKSKLAGYGLLTGGGTSSEDLEELKSLAEGQLVALAKELSQSVMPWPKLESDPAIGGSLHGNSVSRSTPHEFNPETETI